MEIVFVLLPLSLCLALCGLFGFLWAVKRGQYEDLESPQIRILFDNDEDQMAPAPVDDSENNQSLRVEKTEPGR